MLIDTDKTIIGYGGRLLKHPYRMVQFYFPADAIREEVYKRTSVLGKYRTNKDGQSLFDLYTLSQDEASTFDMLLRQAADELNLVLQPFMLRDTESFIYRRDFITASPGLPISVSPGDYVKDLSGNLFRAETPTDTTHLADPEAFTPLSEDVSRSVHFIVKRPANTLPVMLPSVDTAMLEFLVLYIIWQWLLLIESGDGKAQVYGQLFQTARENVRYKMNLCHKKTQSGHPF